jgi:hypothetical protein
MQRYIAMFERLTAAGYGSEAALVAVARAYAIDAETLRAVVRAVVASRIGRAA